MSGLRPPPTRHFYFAENRTFLNWFDKPDIFTWGLQQVEPYRTKNTR